MQIDINLSREDRAPKEENKNEKKLWRNLKRARKKLTLTAYANMGQYPKWATLTYHFQEGAFNLDRARKDLQNWKERLSRSIGEPVKWLGVWEIQPDSKQYHAHMLIFNEPKIDWASNREKWQEVIGGGDATFRIGTIGSETDRDKRVRYLCKYMTEDTIAAIGQHVYFRSNGLKQPEHYMLEDLADLSKIIYGDIDPNNQPPTLYPHVKWAKMFAWDGNIRERIEMKVLPYRSDYTWSEIEEMGATFSKKVKKKNPPQHKETPPQAEKNLPITETEGSRRAPDRLTKQLSD